MADQISPREIRGSREKFGSLGVWARQRAAIIVDNDPVKWRRLGMGGMADKVQQDQNRQLRELEQVVDRVWESEIGRLWQIADRVDQQLLNRQLDDLAGIAECFRPPGQAEGGSRWQALEGVINLLGELRDWGEGR